MQEEIRKSLEDKVELIPEAIICEQVLENDQATQKVLDETQPLMQQREVRNLKEENFMLKLTISSFQNQLTNIKKQFGVQQRQGDEPSNNQVIMTTLSYGQWIQQLNLIVVCFNNFEL